MDRVLNTLSRLDWGSIEHAQHHCTGALRELSRPGVLRELLAGLLSDRRLLGLSERHAWGDRLVLWDDPVNHWRIRLHRFEEQTDDPHSHQWPFHTLILHGSYQHLLYGTERSVRLAMERTGAVPAPSLVRTEAPGSSYAIDDRMVHVVKTRVDTVSVVVQGPRTKDRAFRIRAGRIVPPDTPRPSLAAIRAVRTSSDRIGEIVELAHRVGLIDTDRV